MEPPGWITERIKLAEMMEKEVWVTVEHPKKKYQPVKCRNIIMIVGRTARFIQPDDWKEGDTRSSPGSTWLCPSSCRSSNLKTRKPLYLIE